MTVFELSPEVVYAALASTMLFVLYSVYSHRPVRVKNPVTSPHPRSKTDVLPRNNRI